jgi:hypothetical protein
MGAVKQEIGELDFIAFSQAVGRWPVGTRGTVVIDFGDAKMVEISNDRGETLDLPVVPVDKLELIEKFSD